MEEVDELELMVERVAGLDLGKAELVACVRVPHLSKPGRRMQEIRTYRTTTAQLLELAAWLRVQRVQRVVMESTGDYWKGVYFLLEAEGFQCWLVNARDVKNTPGSGQNRQARRGLVGEGGRAGHVPPVAGAPARDPAAAGLDPIPSCLGR
jgi:transposase